MTFNYLEQPVIAGFRGESIERRGIGKSQGVDGPQFEAISALAGAANIHIPKAIGSQAPGCFAHTVVVLFISQKMK